jgi:hypothetical protein
MQAVAAKWPGRATAEHGRRATRGTSARQPSSERGAPLSADMDEFSHAISYDTKLRSRQKRKVEPFPQRCSRVRSFSGIHGERRQSHAGGQVGEFVPWLLRLPWLTRLLRRQAEKSAGGRGSGCPAADSGRRETTDSASCTRESSRRGRGRATGWVGASSWARSGPGAWRTSSAGPSGGCRPTGSSRPSRTAGSPCTGTGPSDDSTRKRRSGAGPSTGSDGRSHESGPRPR